MNLIFNFYMHIIFIYENNKYEFLSNFKFLDMNLYILIFFDSNF